MLSAADLHVTLTKLIGSTELPTATQQKLRQAHPSESMFTVFFGLNGSERLRQELQRFQESHVVYTCKDGNYIKLVLLNQEDSQAAPEGKYALMISMLSPYKEWLEEKTDKFAYIKKKRSFTEEIITRAEEFLPSLRDRIEVQEAATPLTYERYTSNWQGGTSGWSWDPKFAPRFSYPKDIPIKNLSMVGHYVSNPGGIPAAMITAWYIVKSMMNKASC